MAERTRPPRLRVASLLLVVPLLAGAPAFAWGPNGHRVVARIAENHLSDAARTGVRELLGTESLARASTWADEIRSEREWDRAAAWHFISIDDGETLETTRRSENGDVLSAMERFEAVLRNPDAEREEKVQALRFLVHFVADVHQPLHVGRRSDGGGNGRLVLWFGDPTNLHHLWDTSLVEFEELSFSELAGFLDHPSPDEIAAWQASSYADWIAESLALRERVYDFGDHRLGYGYAHENVPIVERRLLQAGIRLAGLLNELFRPAAPPP